jgi:hypothetical protein
MDDWSEVERLLVEQSGVIARRQTPVRCRAARWRVRSGRWQRPHHGVFVAHSGEMSREQRMWVALLAAAADAALRASTAAELGGLKGFERDVIYVALKGKSAGPRLAGTKYSRNSLFELDVVTERKPPRLALPVAVVEMAADARTVTVAHQVLTAAVQQRLVRTSDLRDAVARRKTLRQRVAILETLLDIDDGAQSLNELAMLGLIERFELPPPVLQIAAATRTRRSRIDGGWPSFGVYFEIDGAGHYAIEKWADDADRHNEVTLATPPGSIHLRWPGFVVRHQPERVADQARRALGHAAKLVAEVSL